MIMLNNVKLFCICNFYKKVIFRQILNASPKLGEEITLVGWIKSINILKNKTFIRVKDGRSNDSIQIVVPSEKKNEHLQLGSCIKVFGKFVESLGILQNKEIMATHIETFSSEYSFEDKNLPSTISDGFKTGINDDACRNDYLHLRHRFEHFAAVGRIRESLKRNMRNVINDKNYIEMDVTCLTKNDCEGTGEIYTINCSSMEDKSDLLKLTVSRQLHLEALVIGYSRVYALGPIFRNDKSQSKYHLSEFQMLEVESIDLVDMESLCKEIECIVRRSIQLCADERMEDISLIGSSNIAEENVNAEERINKILKADRFYQIKFSDAVKILKGEGYLVNSVKGFNKTEEKRLIDIVGNGCPVFITHFPRNQKPFYCKVDNQDGLSLAVDLLMPSVGEVVGGSVREDDEAKLKNAIVNGNINMDSISWYHDLRLLGGCPHGGFGLGFDRLVQFVGGISNIHDAVIFPRTYKTCRL